MFICFWSLFFLVASCVESVHKCLLFLHVVVLQAVFYSETEPGNESRCVLTETNLS